MSAPIPDDGNDSELSKYAPRFAIRRLRRLPPKHRMSLRREPLLCPKLQVRIVGRHPIFLPCQNLSRSRHHRHIG
jgi:hypothetical protein